MAPYRVILLPGSVLPGDLAYGSLVAALGSASDAVVKELEVYATPEAPLDYTLELEVGGVGWSLGPQPARAGALARVRPA